MIQKTSEKCQLCDVVGHTAKTCFKAKSANEPKICQFCDKRGHLATGCFKLHPELANQMPKCTYCNNFGHTEERCRNKQRDQPRETEPTLPVVELFSEDNYNPVYTIPSTLNKSPSIRINLPTPAFLLIDTGAHPSLVKQKVLSRNHKIDKRVTLTLSGITSQTVQTLGKITIEIFETPCEFHVVSDDFPIEFDGILGTSFLQKRKSTIDYNNKCIFINNHKIPFANTVAKTCKIPARTRQMISVKIVNGIKTGLVPLTKILPGVFYGNSVVENKNGIAYLLVINTTEKEVEIDAQSVELEEIDILEAASETEQISAIASTDERFDKILQLINLDHLSDPIERYEIIELIKSTSDVFHLPSEPLSATHLVTHKIPTTDSEPVHVKQYRYPFAMKSEIEKQIKKLHEDGIIEESNSPFCSPLWCVPKRPSADGTKQFRVVFSSIECQIGPRCIPNDEYIRYFRPARRRSVFHSSGFSQRVSSDPSRSSRQA